MLNRTRHLPWIVALTAFVLYAGTMGTGMTFNGLPLATKVAGWDVMPMVGQPLLWLLTLPLKVFPAAWMAGALKLLAAALAALVLAVLTRTVQLLPWERPWDEASRFVVMLPVITAAVVCGLEFNFWQEATSTCGELLDVLLLAGALWLLLEYNVRRGPRWLDIAVLVWGMGMAENWLMLLTLPLFIAGLIWLMKLRFFRWPFILRMAALGLAGCSIYALLPMVNGLSPHSPWTLGQAWLASLRQTKNVELLLYYQFWRAHRLLSGAILIYYLVPTLPLLIKIQDTGNENIPGVDRFQIWLYRGLRTALLAACFWLALDPTIGARQLVQKQMLQLRLGIHFPLLSLDYFTALGAGFLTGCLLLIALDSTPAGYRRSRGKFRWQRLAIPLVTIVSTAAAAALVVRNAPAIVEANFHPVEQFGTDAVNSLPDGHGVVLSDFPDKLIVFQAALAHSHQAEQWLAVDTRRLPTTEYRAWLQRRQPASGWLTDANRHELSPLEALFLLEQVARTNRLFYLHPSFGHFFEGFYLAPVETILEMKRRGNDPLAIPALTGDALEANEKTWSRLWDTRLRVLIPVNHANPFLASIAHYGLTPVPRLQEQALAEWYSIMLDNWGVALQKEGHWREAQGRLEQALQLNTNNLSARLSLSCNTNYQAGVKMDLAGVPRAVEQLGDPSHIYLVVGTGGPFDEPTVEYVLGLVYFQHGYLLQAAEQFERVRTLAPNAMGPELVLADIYNRLQMPERGKPLLSHLRDETRSMQTNNAMDLSLTLLESYSSLLETNVSNARNLLQSLVARHPDDPQINERVLAAYLSLGDVTNALRLVEAQLAKSPDAVSSLNNKAVILLQCGRSHEALPILDHVLALTNQPAARINRAFTRMAMKDFAGAGDDLHQLEENTNHSPMVDFGLAAVADNQHDTNRAVHYLQTCLSNTVPAAALWKQACANLQRLQPPHQP